MTTFNGNKNLNKIIGSIPMENDKINKFFITTKAGKSIQPLTGPRNLYFSQIITAITFICHQTTKPFHNVFNVNYKNKFVITEDLMEDLICRESRNHI